MTQELTDLAVTFTSQQLGLIDRHLRAGGASDRAEWVRQALFGSTPGVRTTRGERPASSPRAGRVLREVTIEPGTGKAVEVRAGQVVRVSQTTGGQCADFNVFNLNDRNEKLHVGRTRSLHGTGPTTGDFVWSNAPWERPLLVILADTGRTDTEFPSCSAQLYWRLYGERSHTNCQQMQTEAQREYGLAPHEVHESLNLFMYCAYDDPDAPQVRPNLATADDFIEFLALEDVLAVFNVCGDDFDRTNNFTFTPLVVTVLEADADDLRLAGQFARADHDFELLESPYPRAFARLVPDPDYVPAFPHAPVRMETVTFALDASELDQLIRVADLGLYGDDLAAALRDVLVTWTIHHPRLPA
ncbi:MAG: urea carboxylase-associated family protein [Actinobacteria bacterium]|nr:urea carboxylase-associated family protein [Actinomycetota bacterium]